MCRQLETGGLHRSHWCRGIPTPGSQPRAGQEGIEVPPVDGHIGRDSDQRFVAPRETVASGVGNSHDPVDGQGPSPNDQIRRGVQDLAGTQVVLDRLEHRPRLRGACTLQGAD